MHLQYPATTPPNAILYKLTKSTFTNSKNTNKIKYNNQTFLLKTCIHPISLYLVNNIQ